MGGKLLREVCESIGVTRRAVQGYEQMGLVSPTGRNKMGYLLYDEEAQNKIRQIKQYQDFGFTLSEIKKLDNASAEEIRIALEYRVEKIRQDIKRMTDILSIAENMLNML